MSIQARSSRVGLGNVHCTSKYNPMYVPLFLQGPDGEKSLGVLIGKGDDV